METKTYYALDKFGNSIPDATVGIYYRGEAIPSVVIYDKNGAVLPNPFNADSTGRITFQVADGQYEIQISNSRSDGYRIPFQALDMLDPTGKINTAVTEAEAAAAQAELMRDQTQQIIDDAGEQSTLVVLAQPSGADKSGFDIDNPYQNISIGKTLEDLFRNEQLIEHYYDKNGGNWNLAHEQAHWNVYKRGLSQDMVWPKGRIYLQEPLWGGPALGDILHEKHPTENFYNASTGRYAAIWDFQMRGVYCRSSDKTGVDTKGTQFILSVADENDTTWKDYGIIHIGPKEYNQRRMSADVKKYWPGNAYLRDFNVAGECANGGKKPWMHAIYSFRSGKNFISGLNWADVWGGGLILDWAFEAIIHNSLGVNCGRMINRDYFSQGKVNADYMLYAAFQTMFTPSGNVNDNTNFTRLIDCHFEDCTVAADVIIGGRSSPTWLERLHFECATTAGTSAEATNKTAVCAGGFGARFFGVDSQEGFDNTAATVTPGAGQGNVKWNGGALYKNTYAHAGQLAGAGRIEVTNLSDPNTSDFRCRTAGTGAAFIFNNSDIGNVEMTGGNSNQQPLKISNCRNVGNVTLDYVHPCEFSNSRIGDLKVTNPYNNTEYDWVLDASFNSIDIQTVQRARGVATLRSATAISKFRTGKGKLKLSRYEYFETNFLGALQSSILENTVSCPDTQLASTLIQEGRYTYGASQVGSTTGLPWDGRAEVRVENDTPNSYVTQTVIALSTRKIAHRVIPYASGSYGTPSAWSEITTVII